MEPNSADERVIQAKVIVSGGTTYHVVTCVRPAARNISPMVLPWPEWLAARILLSALRKYRRSVLLAHTLREMTLLGFSAAHIQRTMKRMCEDFRLANELALAKGFKPMNGDEFFSEGPGKKAKADAPKMTFSPSFNESFSEIPPDDRKQIKRSIARLKRRSLSA